MTVRNFMSVRASDDGRFYSDNPSGGARATPLDNVRKYTFNHSLYNHNLPLWQCTGNWIGRIAEHESLGFYGAGDFEQIVNHVTQWATRAAEVGYDGAPVLEIDAPDPLPAGFRVSPQYEFPNATLSGWTSGTWQSYDWTHAYIMTDNFTFDEEADYVTRIVAMIDNIASVQPDAEVVLYNTIHEAGSRQTGPHPTDPDQDGPIPNWPNLAAADYQRYRNFVRGDWLDYQIRLQDAVLVQRPSANFKHIPVGQIIMDLIEEPYMSAFVADTTGSVLLFEDSAPHGQPNIHFLYALVCFIADYRRSPDLTGFTPPVGVTLHPDILANLSPIVNFFAQRLQYYNINGVLVYRT